MMYNHSGLAHASSHGQEIYDVNPDDVPVDWEAHYELDRLLQSRDLTFERLA